MLHYTITDLIITFSVTLGTIREAFRLLLYVTFKLSSSSIQKAISKRPAFPAVSLALKAKKNNEHQSRLVKVTLSYDWIR